MIFPVEFIIGLAFLGYFSYLDLRHSEVNNKPIMTFLGISLVFAYISHQFILNLVLMAFLFVLGYYLWTKGALGGADVKILPGLVPFFGFVGWGESISGLIFFLIAFSIVGAVYGLTAKYLIKKKEVPFVPVILLCFIIIFLLNTLK